MRLKAPADRGHPVVNNEPIEPDKDGVYHVDDATGDVLQSHGYIDIDAPPKPAPAAPAINLMTAAVAELLKKFGVKAVGDIAMIAALNGLPKIVDARIEAAAKAAEDKVITQFADEQAALKVRAENAEARVADLERAAVVKQPAKG